MVVVRRCSRVSVLLILACSGSEFRTAEKNSATSAESVPLDADEGRASGGSGRSETPREVHPPGVDIALSRDFGDAGASPPAGAKAGSGSKTAAGGTSGTAEGVALNLSTGGESTVLGGVAAEDSGTAAAPPPPVATCSKQTPGCVLDWAGSWRAAGARDGQGAGAGLSSVAGITSHGRYVYISDNHAIRRIDTETAMVETIAGTLGEPGLEDGVGSEARFKEPVGLATDGRWLWVADSGNSEVRTVDLASFRVSTLSGLAGEDGKSDGSPAHARFKGMRGLTFDGTFLFVVEADNHDVRRISVENGYVYTVAGGQGSGLSDGIGSSARFNAPAGVTALGPGQLVVGDTKNHRPRFLEVSPEDMNHLQVSSPYGSKPGHQDGTGTGSSFFGPEGLTYTGSTLVVADTENSVLRSIDMKTRAVTTIAGVAGESGHASGVGTDARFDRPSDVHFDKESGDLFIADGSVLLRMYD